ncbi:MAG TPA: hypothetical protein VF250_13825 [Conexibacter sp.]
MASTTDITVRDGDLRVGGELASWLESEQLEELIHDAYADPALLRELDALLPDTIADL